MTTAARIVAATVALALLLTSPLAPVALAQQPAQPDLFKETLKASQAGDPDQSKYEAGAVILNIGYVPGKALVCLAGSFGAFAVMALTFGSGYKAAVGAFREGCGGKWALNADDLRPEPPGVDFSSPRPSD